MRYQFRPRSVQRMAWTQFVLLTAALFRSASVTAADDPTIAERPWASAWISSIARVLAACDSIYDSVDRPDLAETLEERQKSFRGFQGIDRKRPLGMMWAWAEEDRTEIYFIPIQQADELIKTATLGIVDSHKVSETEYEIERPGVPYHAILRNGYALLGEDVTALNAMRNAPERLTRDLKGKYDIVVMLDQRQVPKVSKQKWIDSLRRRFEPWVQQQDNEPIESALIRSALEKGLLTAMQQAINDTQTVTAGLRIDPRTNQLQLDLILQAETGSSFATNLNRLVVRRSEFSALVNRDVSAGLAVNWPVALLNLPGFDPDQRGQRLDLGIQLVGNDWSDMTVVAGLRGAEAVALIAAMPGILAQLEKSTDISKLSRDVATYRNVTMHQLVPTKVPDLILTLLHPELQVLVGQGKEVVWLAAGNPMLLQERLQAAIDAVEETPATQRTGSIMQGRLSVSKWPQILPIVDPSVAKEALEKAKDGFTVSVQPIKDGLKITFAAEEGLLRVIGRHWATQVDQTPPVNR